MLWYSLKKVPDESYKRQNRYNWRNPAYCTHLIVLLTHRGIFIAPVPPNPEDYVTKCHKVTGLQVTENHEKVVHRPCSSSCISSAQKIIKTLLSSPCQLG